MRAIISKWNSVSSNTLFGIFKSVLSYLFILALYKFVTTPDAVKHYIDYEVWAAASILIGFGLQGHAYKTLKYELISVLYFVLVVLATLAIIFYFMFKESSSLIHVVLMLVVLDRCLDIALQIERQFNRFSLYNWNDITNSILVKLGFLAYAVGRDYWAELLIVKVVVCYYFLWRQITVKVFIIGLSEIKFYFSNRRQFAEWYAFDILNFSVMNLDLVFVRIFAPGHLTELYFYVRKFVRLPLVLLNYVIDPVYVLIRRIDVKQDAALKLIGFVVPVYYGAFFCLVCIGGFLFLHFDSTSYSVFGFSVAITSFVLVVNRFGDLYVLLFCSQRHRLVLRTLSLIGVFIIPLGCLFPDGVFFTLLLFPLLGWVIALKWIFNTSFRSSLFQLLYVFVVMGGLWYAMYFLPTKNEAVLLILSFGLLAGVMAQAMLKQFILICRRL